MADRATFVTYRLTNGAREVVMVYATQPEAANAAAGDAALFAQTGAVNSDVKPGDFITSTGSLLSAPPAAVRDEREKPEHRSLTQAAFLEYQAGRPVWLAHSGVTNDQQGLQAADKWAFMAAVLIDHIVEEEYLKTQSRSTRNDFIEHILKNLREVRAPYDRLRGNATNRQAWAQLNLQAGQPVYSDMVSGTLGQPQDPSGTAAVVSSLTIPSKFDPTQPTLRRP